MSEPENTSPMCEECDIPMHPYNYGSITGFACDGCGWSDEIDTAPEPDPRSPETRPELDIEELKYRNSVFEGLMHKIQMCYDVTSDSDGVQRILKAMSAWSYAHRMGNGGLSEDKRKEIVDKIFVELAEMALGKD